MATDNSVKQHRSSRPLLIARRSIAARAQLIARPAMSSLDLTRDWLHNVLRAYPSKDVIIPQVLSILQNRRSLAVKTDAFSEIL
jgi:hypothetical protein